MKKSSSILVIAMVIAFIVITTGFIVYSPKADFEREKVKLSDLFSISDLTTKNAAIGNFKTAVKFSQKPMNYSSKEFYGQEILLKNNPTIDRICIGITNNHIARIEVWNKNELIEAKELGFMNKMTWGENQSMVIDFYDQTNKKYAGKSKISMRFYEGTGFFGDIATISLSLTKYGDLNIEKSVKLFAKSLEAEKVHEPNFTTFRIWKNYTSWD